MTMIGDALSTSSDTVDIVQSFRRGGSFFWNSTRCVLHNGAQRIVIRWSGVSVFRALTCR